LKPLVSIIIVNWNGVQHLECCLASLKAQSFRDFEVVLVDNGSSDGSVAYLKERHPWVRLVELQENTGFATGNNVGLRHCLGDYVVTLNNDTRAEPDWLETLVRVAQANPSVGMVGSRICSFDDPDLIDSLGHGVCLDGMSRGRFRLQKYSDLELPEVVEILFPSACVALYRRSMLEETGFFDDDFFAYAEDTDLGLRCRLAGWPALLATRAVVYHKYSMTGGSFSAFKVYLVERNHYWVALKSFPPHLLFLVPFYTLLRYFTQAAAVLAGKGSGREFRDSGSRASIAAVLLKGTLHAVAGSARMLAKRREIMRRKRISHREMAHLLKRYRMGFAELLDLTQ